MLDQKPERQSTWTERLHKPHVSISAGLLLFVVGVCVAKRKRPELSQLIEAMAYGAAMWGAVQLLERGSNMASEEGGSWESIVGGVVLGAAAVMGFWDSMAKIGKKHVHEDPKPPKPPSPGP